MSLCAAPSTGPRALGASIVVAVRRLPLELCCFALESFGLAHDALAIGIERQRLGHLAHARRFFPFGFSFFSRTLRHGFPPRGEHSSRTLGVSSDFVTPVHITIVSNPTVLFHVETEMNSAGCIADEQRLADATVTPQ